MFRKMSGGMRLVATTSIYLIKDLSRLSGHSVHTLKFYLKRGLIKEAGRSPMTRFRYFDDNTVKTLAWIRAWRKQGKGLSEIEQLLHQQEHSGMIPVRDMVALSQGRRA